VLCVIMELAAGGDLTKLVNEGKLKGGVDESEIWRALTQMTLGLKSLHDLKISKVTKGAAAKTQAGTPCKFIMTTFRLCGTRSLAWRAV